MSYLWILKNTDMIPKGLRNIYMNSVRDEFPDNGILTQEHHDVKQTLLCREKPIMLRGNKDHEYKTDTKLFGCCGYKKL